MSRGRQTLIGCGLGCLALVLLGIGSCVGFTVWINRPGDVLEPERLLAADATGYVEWTLRLEDTGTQEFLDLLLTEVERVGDEGPSVLPPSLEGPLHRMQRKRNEKKLQRLFPVVLVWTVEPRDQNADDYVLTASLRGLDHQLRFADFVFGWLIGFDEDAQIVSYRDEKIYLLDKESGEDPLPVFVRDGDLFVSTDEESARRTLDQLAAPPLAEAGDTLRPLLGDLPSGSLRGAISNRRGEVWRAWERFVDDELPSELESGTRQALTGVTLVGSFSPKGVFGAQLTFLFDTPEAADRARRPIASSIEAWLEDGPVELASEKVIGASLVYDFEVEVQEIPIPRPAESSR